MFSTSAAPPGSSAGSSLSSTRICARLYRRDCVSAAESAGCGLRMISIGLGVVAPGLMKGRCKGDAPVNPLSTMPL